MREQRGLTVFLTFSVLAMIVLLGVIVVKAVKSAPIYIESFDDCIKSGNEIIEMFPAECKTPDGRTFIQEVSPEVELY